MLRMYKAVKDNKKKSGRGRKTCPYFADMDTLLAKDPNITPIATTSRKGELTFLDNEPYQISISPSTTVDGNQVSPGSLSSDSSTPTTSTRGMINKGHVQGRGSGGENAKNLGRLPET